MTESGIVIIGGGFAGAALARTLERRLPQNLPLLLVSEENFLLFSPLLSEVAGAALLPAHCVVPIRQMLGRTAFRRARVTGIDTRRRRIDYECGGPGSLHYGELVLACGVRARLDLVPGMAEHAFPLKTPGDALELRNRVLLQLERAEAEPDEERRRRLTSFAVVGGGSSGVEVAGALHDLLCTAAPLYPKVDAADCRVSVIEATDRLLGEFPPGLGEFAARHMQRRGISVRTAAEVAGVDAASAMLKDGGRVAAGTIVCTIGTVPQTLIENLGLPMRRGAVQVEPDLRVTGRDHLWALGDCASIPNAADDGVAPPTAQFATREALHLAENLRRALRGEATRPFGYRPRAIMATVGHRRAVARLFGFNFRGVPAWLLWRAVYLAKLPTWLRRVQVFFEWSWQALFPADVTQFHYAPYRLADGTRLDKSPAQQEGCTEDEAQRRAGAR